jgi:hypothetical protein
VSEDDLAKSLDAIKCIRAFEQQKRVRSARYVIALAFCFSAIRVYILNHKDPVSWKLPFLYPSLLI